MISKGFRTLVIENSEKLSFKENCIVCKDNDTILPINQFENVLFETQQTSVSVKLLNAFIDNNAFIVFCDEKHTPCCQLLGLNNHNNLSGNIFDQINWSNENKEIVWKNIIEQKISLQ